MQNMGYTEAHHCFSCIISHLARPILPSAPCSSLPQPYKCLFFFLRAAPLFLAGWAERPAAQCKHPFLRMYVGHPRAGKMLTMGASSARCLPLPSRLSHQPCLPDYHSPLVQTHYAQLKYCASCTALHKTKNVNT